MKLNPPKNVTFWIATILGAAGLVVGLVHNLTRTIPWLGTIGFVLVCAAFVLLFLGLLIKGL